MRGMETLLKRKRVSKGRRPDEEPHTEPDPPTQGPAAEPSPESPAGPSSLHEPPTREQPRIKTREAVSARERGVDAPSPENGRAGPSSGERMRETRIKTRESAVRDPRPDTPPVRQSGPELPQIRTREAAVHDAHPAMEPAAQTRSGLPQIRTRETMASAPRGQRADTPLPGRKKPQERLSIKTRDTCIQRQATMNSEQPSQAFSQGQQKFMQERSRTAAMKRAEAQHPGHSSNTQIKRGEATAPSAPARHGYVGGQGKHAPAQTVRGAAPTSRSMRDGGQTAVKTTRSGRVRHVRIQTLFHRE